MNIFQYSIKYFIEISSSCVRLLLGSVDWGHVGKGHSQSCRLES